jgi:hypothetical protein
MSLTTLIFPAIMIVVAYAIYFRHRSQVAQAGGVEAYARAQMNALFGLSGAEQITAAWSAVTIPQKTGKQKAVEIASAVVGLVAGARVEYVGRSIVLGFTSANRLLVLDRESSGIRSFGPDHRPRIVDTGQAGTKRTSPTKWGWVKGKVILFTSSDGDAMEMDIIETAVPILAGWSQGQSAAQLTGPFPIKGTY